MALKVKEPKISETMKQDGEVTTKLVFADYTITMTDYLWLSVKQKLKGRFWLGGISSQTARDWLFSSKAKPLNHGDLITIYKGDVLSVYSPKTRKAKQKLLVQMDKKHFAIVRKFLKDNQLLTVKKHSIKKVKELYKKRKMGK